MIESILIEELAVRLDLPVFAEYPEAEAPETFVLLYKGGRDRVSKLDTSRFILESYAPSRYAASLLNDRACAALEDLEDLDVVSGIHLVTDYPSDDETHKRHRYQAVYDITHY